MEFLKDYYLLILCISVLTEVLKLRIPAKKLDPKWTSFIVAAVCCIAYIWYPGFDGDFFHLLFAFGCTVLFYKYVIQVAKDLFTKNFTFKKE